MKQKPYYGRITVASSLPLAEAKKLQAFVRRRNTTVYQLLRDLIRDAITADETENAPKKARTAAYKNRRGTKTRSGASRVAA